MICIALPIKYQILLIKYYRGMWPRWPKYDSRKINFGVYREESYRLNIISKMDDKPTKKSKIFVVFLPRFRRFLRVFQ